MRQLIISFVLTLCSIPQSWAFEIEERQMFGDGTGQVLRVISTTDIDVFEPIVRGFIAENPDVSVDYVAASSTELMRAIHGEGAVFDVAVSSAMDLQTKIANDGLALQFRSDESDRLPDWAKWRGHVFAFTQEPATIVVSRKAFAGLPQPKTRQDLIALLRDHPDRFSGRVGTYDVRISGLGYLFATQDARTSETFWRLSEVMGNLNPRLYCCSSDMIDDVASGRIAVAYNVLGSYALARIDAQDRIEVIQPQDFTTVMLRTALIPETSASPEQAGQFIDHLIRGDWAGEGVEMHPFPVIDRQALSRDAALRPIRIGPGLLVYLDRLKRDGFLREWEAAILQR